MLSNVSLKLSRFISALKNECITSQLTSEQKIKIQNNRFASIDWPDAIHEHQFANTKVFQSRENLLSNLPKNADYLEVGVLAGDYTAKIVDHCAPNSVFLVDTFNSNDWFHNANPRFTFETHESFVRNRFSNVKNLNLIKGLSQLVLPSIKEKFDYIYLDADHSYKAFWEDLNNAATLLKPGGIIGINDYIIWDYVSDEPYGVVQATNRFLNTNPNWNVLYFAVATTLFSDIYITKPN
jgi:hypothetical protein